MPRNTPYPRPARRAYLMLALATALTGTLTACESSATAQGAARTPTTARSGVVAAQEARLAELAQQDVDAGAPGVIVRVDNGDGHVDRDRPAGALDQGRPHARRERRVPDGLQHQDVVATVVLQLVAEHRLQLTDPVEKWLPGLVPNGSAITLRMLLNHTSGLFNYINDPDVLKAFTGQDTRRGRPEELIAAGVRHDPLFAPGTHYSYSNTNYVALGLVAEKVDRTQPGRPDPAADRQSRCT